MFVRAVVSEHRRLCYRDSRASAQAVGVIAAQKMGRGRASATAQAARGKTRRGLAVGKLDGMAAVRCTPKAELPLNRRDAESIGERGERVSCVRVRAVAMSSGAASKPGRGLCVVVLTVRGCTSF